MPGGEKLPRCPKGEVRDKKTKKCVKKEKKPSPKKNNNTKKATPKKATPKKATPKKSNSSRKSSSIYIPQLSKFKSSIGSYNVDYIKEFIIRLLKENESYRYRGSGDSFIYYKFNDINTFLKKEINDIKESGEAGGYYFPEEDSKKIIDILTKYEKYFKDIGEDDRMIEQIAIEKLYK